jgi:phage gpG-like protein
MGRITYGLLADFEEGSVMEAVGDILDKPKKLLDAIGLIGVAYAQQSFEEQRLADKPWAPRMNPNIPGIITDVNAGRDPRPQRFTDRPALMDTGNLHGSIAHEVLSDEIVQIGSTLPYAEVHQIGGESEVPELTDEGKGKLWAWMKRQGMGKAGPARQRAAATKQKAAARFTKRQSGIWRRAFNKLMREALADDPAFQHADKKLKRLVGPDGHYPKVKDLKADGSPGEIEEYEYYRKQVARIREKYKKRFRTGGINNQEWREAVEAMRAGYKGDKDASVSKAQEQLKERLAAIREKQQANPMFPIAAKLGFLFNAAPKTITHPARPFLGVPPDMRDEVEQYLGVTIGQVA